MNLTPPPPSQNSHAAYYYCYYYYAQPRALAVNVTLLAFTAERRAAAAPGGRHE